MSEDKSFLTARQIQLAVCVYFDISITAMIGSQRARAISVPRQIAMLLCRELLPARSYPELGRMFNRDHSTVMTGCLRGAEHLMRDKALSHHIDLIRKELSEAEEATDLTTTASLYAESIVDAFRRSVRLFAQQDPAGFIRRAASLIPDQGAPSI